MRNKFLRGIIFCGNLFLRIVEKIATIAKIKTRKNVMPYGVQMARNKMGCFEIFAVELFGVI